MDATLAGAIRVKITGGTLAHKETGAVVVIGDEPRVVGRGGAAHLQLSDRRVSTAHCELVAADRGVLIRDLGSKNGTWLGDVLLGPQQHAFLRQPATIRVGGTLLEFTPHPASEREVGRRFGMLESRSTRMQRVLDQLQKIAAVSATVHITGESGTGKGYLAKAIHDASARASRPFVVIDCAAIPPSLAEAELFGHEKGAFTGATRRKESPFVDADGGTVFLDEVGDLPLEMQARLLRVVEEQEVKSVGQNRYRKIDVRVVSATLHDLAGRVNAGQFREDLYSRLTATRIELPPLRERREDIEPLSTQILTDLGRPDAVDAIPPATLAWMKERDWAKGNVRQLRQVVKLAVELARGGALDVEGAYGLTGGHADAGVRGASESIGEAVFKTLTARGTSYEAVTREASRVLFENLVRETGGNLSEMCRRADLSRPFLRALLSKLGLREIEPPRRRVRGPVDR